MERLQKLQADNWQAAEKLRKAVEEGGTCCLEMYNDYVCVVTCLFQGFSFSLFCCTEVLLRKIREALKEICDSQFGIRDEKLHR